MAFDKDIDYEKCTAEIKEWWKNDPLMPKNIDDVLLQRFVHATYGDTAYAKRVISLNYEIRNKNPHIFLDRDPLSPESQKVFQVCDMIPLPTLTPKDNYRMIFYRLRDLNDSKFDFTEAIKMFFMVADTRFTMNNAISSGDVPIFDAKGFSLKHMTKAIRAFSVLRVYMNFTQNAFPVRLKQIHVVNVSPFVDKILSFIKPLMKKEVTNSLKFHLPNSETIFEYIPKDMLPVEYGGEGPSMDELKKDIVKQIESKRDYLTDMSYWKMNFSKQQQEINANLVDLKNLSID
ncbi:alpha-tocopherol transfer protein-like [Culicoides brevitarsis]|uniref:alpha-tocopherol transfer protein-like n=1 Tax=Culicoides brevitarsis TaxID=469753 RepID=UPI00307C7915